MDTRPPAKADDNLLPENQPTNPIPLTVENRPTAPITPVKVARLKKRKRKLSPLGIALTSFGLILLLGGGSLAAVYYYTIQRPVSQFIRPVGRPNNDPRATASPSYDNIKGRSWNLLLLGSDNDAKYTFPAVLTQVMMIVHVDTLNNSVYMVSIPRDSWVYVPEIGGMHKIDQAFFMGAVQNNTFEKGVQLARLTIEQDYGMTIDRYAWVGLSGFAKVIDTLGGVDIDITHPIVDDTYPHDTGKGASPDDPYAYKRIYIAPGPQHMTGEQALEYVRSRHADLVGDIGRTVRQQQVLEALKKKLNAANIISNLPALLQDLVGQVYTDLSQQEMIEFANFGRSLDNKAIKRLTLGPGEGKEDYGQLSSVYDPTYGAYQSVVLPNCQNIQPVINQIFGLGDAKSCRIHGPG